MLLAGALALPSAAVAERSDWRVMCVGHFELLSTLSDSGTRNVARQLLGFEQTLGEMLKTGDRLPDTPTRIYLLSDRDFNQYAAPRPGLEGFFVEGRFGNIMVVDADKPFEWVRVSMFHEFVHYIQRSTSTRKYPPWYTEGYAELFSGYKLNGVKLSVGDQPVGTSLDRAHWIPVERLLAVRQTDPEYQTEGLAPQFYGESWVLVHLLLFDDQTLTAPAVRYLEALNEGFPEPEAFAAAFPFDKAPLTRLTPTQADALLHANGDDAANRQALAILGGLVRIEDPPVEAVELWTNAAKRNGVSPAQIIAILEPLLVRVPHDTAVLQRLAWAYEASGDRTRSRDAYNQIILVSASPEERHWAQQQADSARLQDTPPPAAVR